MQMVLALLHMPALEDTACYVRKTISMCRRTGAKIGTVMLDREFFSTDVIRVLEDLGVDYLIPCVNTANVVKAIEEFSRGERPAVSVFRIAKSKNDYVEYIMHITGRRKKSRKKSKSESCVEKPEEKYIAFATNRSDIDVKCYSERWMIETGFRMIENQRVRTRSRSVTVRTLCFLYSLVLFNSWVLANAELTNNPSVFGGVYYKITQTDMKIIIMMHALPWNGRYEEPPPGVLLPVLQMPLVVTSTCHVTSAVTPTRLSVAATNSNTAFDFCRRFLRRTYRSTAMHPSLQSTPARLEF